MSLSFPGSSTHSSSGPSIQAMETCEQLVLPGYNPQAGEEGSVESRKMRLGQLNGRMRWQLEESSLEDPTGVSGQWRETSGVVGLGVCRSCCLGRRKLGVPGKWNGQERKGGWRCMHGLDY